MIEEFEDQKSKLTSICQSKKQSIDRLSHTETDRSPSNDHVLVDDLKRRAKLIDFSSTVTSKWNDCIFLQRSENALNESLSSISSASIYTNELLLDAQKSIVALIEAQRHLSLPKEFDDINGL